MSIETFRGQSVQKSIAISGCARSGTSILGSVIASSEGIEYSYDSPFLHHLIYLIDKIHPEHWKQMFKVYIYDEVLLDKLAGRGLNQNRFDLTNAVKLQGKEVLKRLDQSNSRGELEKSALNHRVAFKVTDLNFVIDQFISNFPTLPKVSIVRDPANTISSLMKKGWFNKTQDEVSGFTTVIPRYRSSTSNSWIPTFVDSSDELRWQEMEEDERCRYYYYKSNSCLKKASDQVILVDYERFTKHPNEVCAKLFDMLGLVETDRSKAIIEGVFPSKEIKDNQPVWKEGLELYNDLKSKAI